MQNVSAADKTLVEAYGKIALRLYVDGIQLTAPLGTVSYTAACGDNDALTIGNACACGIEMGIDGGHPEFGGKPFRVTWAVSDTEYPLITGTLCAPTVSAGHTSIQGYDAMYWGGSGIILPPDELKQSCAALTVLQYIAAQMGVSLDESTDAITADAVIDGGLSRLPEDCSLAQAAGYVAGLLGGNAQISRSGKLQIRRWSACGFATEPYSGEAEAQAQNYSVDGVTFHREQAVTKINADGTTSEDTESLDYSGGSAPRIMMENPLATQTDADRAAQYVQGTAIRKGSYAFPGGILLEPGDIMTVKSMDGNYNVLCSVLTMVLDGGTRTTVECAGEDESGGYSGTISQQLTEIQGELLRVGKLVAKNAEIGSANIHRLETADLSADRIKTGSLTITDESGDEIFNADLDKKTVNMASARVSIDGQSFNSRIAESVTDFKLSPLNQLSGSKNLKDDRYYLTSDIYALAGRALVGQHTLRATSATADWADTTVPDDSTDSVLRLLECAGMSYRLVGISVEIGKTYTFSVRAKAASATTVKFSVLGNAAQTENVGTDWSAITITCVAQANTILISPVENGAVYLYHAMLQSGEIPTAWTPNTEEDTEKITELTQKYSEVQQDVDGIRTEVGNQVTGAKTYIDQQIDGITLNVTNSSGGTTSIAITPDHEINLNGDVIADALTVAKLFAKDITVSGNFTIDNGEYYLASYVAAGTGESETSNFTVVKLCAADGKNATYLEISKLGISLASSNYVSITTGLSGGLLIDGRIAATMEDIGLWSFTDISYGADLNDYTACGYYKYSDDATASSITNCPVSSAFTMRVWNALGVADHDAISGQTWRYRLQRLTTWNGYEYIRYATTGNSGTAAFSAWRAVKYDE